VEHFHFARGDVRIGARGAVAAALGLGVDGEVFGGRGDAAVLEGSGHAYAQFGDVVGIFAVGLDDAAPARIAGEIEERRVDTRVADGAGFGGDHGADAGGELAIPGGAERDVGGEIGGANVVEAAHALVGEIDGNAEARLLDEPALDGVEGVDGGGGRLVVGRLRVFPDAVVHLVDVGEAVFPNGVFHSGVGSGSLRTRP
jgi:hypothetical protein